jgi:hypothetical protein
VVKNQFQISCFPHSTCTATARGSVGRLAPEEAQARAATLAGRLRSHLVAVLAAAAAATAPVQAVVDAGAGAADAGGGAAEAETGVEDAGAGAGAAEADDDGSRWLATAAAARAERAFREPLAAAALEVGRCTLNSVDP